MKKSPEESLSPWQKIDRICFNFERGAVILVTAVMTIMVFVAVVWRMFAAPSSKLADFLAKNFDFLAESAETTALFATSILWLLLCLFAVYTARPKWPPGRTVLIGSALALGSYAAAKLFVLLVPEGLVFAQRIALSCMLWMVMLGSSMAAYQRRHIFVQAAQKAVPNTLLPAHTALSYALAALFTLFLTIVCWEYAWANWITWSDSQGQRGIFESIPIPYWSVTISVPLGFALTMLRFTSQAWLIYCGKLDPIPPMEGMDKLEESQA
jgi:TRAP-type C4-dicarboxylate transport system permease small subunit